MSWLSEERNGSSSRMLTAHLRGRRSQHLAHHGGTCSAPSHICPCKWLHACGARAFVPLCQPSFNFGVRSQRHLLAGADVGWEGSEIVSEGAGRTAMNSELSWNVSTGQSWTSLVDQCQVGRGVASPGRQRRQGGHKQACVWNRVSNKVNSVTLERNLDS